MIFGFDKDGHLNWLDRVAIVLIALGLCLMVSCSYAPVKPDVTPEPVPTATPVPEPSPNDTSQGYIKYLPDETATLENAKLVKRVEVLVNKVVQSKCAADMFAKKDLKLNETKDSPAKVYERVKNARIDAIFSYYKTVNPWSSAVAYREGNTFYFNTRKIGAWSDCDFSSTALHEASHMSPLLYDHAFDYYNGRDFTAPYFLNQVVDACCPGLDK